MSYLATVRQDGSLHLGQQAISAGYAPGTVVEIIVASSGSLIVAIDQSAPPMEVNFRPLHGGAAQLAARNDRRRAG